MRYEAKHQEFKHIAKISGNFVNICKTLAERHQPSHCYWLSSNDVYAEKLEVALVKIISF